MKKQTDKTIHLLLSGKHPLLKRYAGKHVFVVHDEIVPLKEGKRGLADFKRLKQKHGESPVAVFVTHPGVSYILVSR